MNQNLIDGPSIIDTGRRETKAFMVYSLNHCGEKLIMICSLNHCGENLVIIISLNHCGEILDQSRDNTRVLRFNVLPPRIICVAFFVTNIIGFFIFYS